MAPEIKNPQAPASEAQIAYIQRLREGFEDLAPAATSTDDYTATRWIDMYTGKALPSMHASDFLSKADLAWLDENPYTGPAPVSTRRKTRPSRRDIERRAAGETVEQPKPKPVQQPAEYVAWMEAREAAATAAKQEIAQWEYAAHLAARKALEAPLEGLTMGQASTLIDALKTGQRFIR